jgi:hypothetical protein
MCFYGFLKLIAKEEWLPAETGNFLPVVTWLFDRRRNANMKAGALWHDQETIGQPFIFQVSEYRVDITKESACNLREARNCEFR